MTYRFLAEGERIVRGDEYHDIFGRWRPAELVGILVSSLAASEKRYRRPVFESAAEGGR